MYSIAIKNIVVQKKDNWGRKSTILKGLDLCVPKNSIFAFIGANGAGKTTTINTLLGLNATTHGTIDLVSTNIGYAPDEANYYDYLTGLEHCLLLGKLGNQTKQDIKKQANHRLKEMGLEFALHKYVKTYSKGMKQRLGLAISLLNDPDILIWDEPMNGLDPLGRKLVKNLIKSLKSQGKTIFFSTHILSDVEEIADEFALIHDGSILATQKIGKDMPDLESFFVQHIKKYDHVGLKKEHIK